MGLRPHRDIALEGCAHRIPVGGRSPRYTMTSHPCVSEHRVQPKRPIFRWSAALWVGFMLTGAADADQPLPYAQMGIAVKSTEDGDWVAQQFKDVAASVGFRCSIAWRKDIAGFAGIDDGMYAIDCDSTKKKGIIFTDTMLPTNRFVAIETLGTTSMSPQDRAVVRDLFRKLLPILKKKSDVEVSECIANLRRPNECLDLSKPVPESRH